METPINQSTIIERQISALEPLAARLNDESDDLNRIISTISEKLAALNLGIKVYDTSGTPYVKDSDDEDAEPHPRPGWFQYGFDKVDDKWQLAIRTWCEADPYIPNDQAGWAYDPLLSESRDSRIHGLVHLSTIVDLLRAEAEDRLQALAEARKLSSYL